MANYHRYRFQAVAPKPFNLALLKKAIDGVLRGA